MLTLTDFAVKRGRFVTKPVTLSLNPGQLVQVIGPNGSGKTTLLDGIGGFAKSQGGISWNGTDIKLWSAGRRHQRIFARQFQNVRWDVRVSDLLGAAQLVGVGRTVEQRQSLIDDLIEDVPTASRLNELSFGQRSRVMLASATLRNMPILMLDEPFDGADAGNVAKIQRLIQELLARRNGIILVGCLCSTEYASYLRISPSGSHVR